MKKFTFKEFVNGEVSILVNSKNIEHVLNCLSKTDLTWNSGQNPNEYNPFDEFEELKEEYVSLAVCDSSVCSNTLFFNIDIEDTCPLIRIDQLNIEKDDLKIIDFIGQCIKSDGQQFYTVGELYYFKNGVTINYEGENSRTYDSIEDFNKRNNGIIEMTKIKEVKRKAEVGEYVKIVDPYAIPNRNGILDYDKGSILKIISINEYGICYYSDSFLCEDEYVVLEGYKGFNEDEIEVGDMVEVVNSRMCFNTYYEWFKETNNLEYENHYVKWKLPTENKKYKLVCKGKHRKNTYHPDYQDGVYCIQDPDTTQVFLMIGKGIKKWNTIYMD